jgi:GH35 family endo-1,4-beta-xylanase
MAIRRSWSFPILVALAGAFVSGCSSGPESVALDTGDMSVNGAARPYSGNLEYVGSTWPSNTFSDVNFLFYWNQVTPEEASLWSEAEPRLDEMEWDDLDDAVRIAQVTGAPARMHSLIASGSEPEWIAGMEAEQQLEQIDEWFAALAERYPEIAFVDVVDDPLGEAPVYAEALGGEGATGYDWVVRSMEIARERFPSSSLAVNQADILYGSQLDVYIDLLCLLIDRDLIDGIGVKAHNLEAGDLRRIQGSLDALGTLGLPVYITEFDVDMISDRDQERRIAELFPLFANHRAVSGITFWGYREGRLRRTNSYLMRADGSHRPALDWLIAYAGLPLPFVPHAQEDL